MKYEQAVQLYEWAISTKTVEEAEPWIREFLSINPIPCIFELLLLHLICGFSLYYLIRALSKQVKDWTNVAITSGLIVSCISSMFLAYTDINQKISQPHMYAMNHAEVILADSPNSYQKE